MNQGNIVKDYGNLYKSHFSAKSGMLSCPWSPGKTMVCGSGLLAGYALAGLNILITILSVLSWFCFLDNEVIGSPIHVYQEQNRQ